jgi:DMSO reductase family type II enzyme chaperone
MNKNAEIIEPESGEGRSLSLSLSEIELALCRATLFSAVALGFRPPSEETIGRFANSEDAAALADAAAILDVDGRLELVERVTALANIARAGVAPLAASYVTLFGHTARGPVPPYETEYGNEALFQQAQELGDLMGFYNAFGLTIKSGEHERSDHISCECEFLSFLALKEAYALERRDSQMLDETRKAQRLFLKDHLARFLPTFVQKLSRADRSDFYSGLAEWCLRFVTQDSARLNVALGAANLTLRPAEDDQVPMACGSGTECTAMPGVGDPENADFL